MKITMLVVNTLVPVNVIIWIKTKGKFMSRMKIYEIIHPITGEITKQLRSAPRIYADLDYGPGDNPVQQQFKQETDINWIVKNYQIPNTPVDLSQYGDFSDPITYQSAMNILATADQQFMLLSPEIRARFENDPQKMLEFVANPENSKDLIKMGLATETLPRVPSDLEKAINANTEAIKAKSDMVFDDPKPLKGKPTK